MHLKVFNTEQLHAQACKEKKFWYTDPKTGFRVLTSYFLTKRAYCCRSGCRHCPYGFNVEKGKQTIEDIPREKITKLCCSPDKQYKTIVINTPAGDAIVKKKNQSLTEAYEFFKNLSNKKVYFEGILEHEYYVIDYWKVLDED